MTLTILDGSTFCISDSSGDLDGEPNGFFAEDTRFLSRYVLRIDGERPLLLSSGRVEYFSAAFYSRNPLVPGLPQDALSVIRQRFVGDGMQDHVVLRNETMASIACELELELAVDFGDIISVKQHDFAFGDPLHARPLPPPAAACFDPARNQIMFSSAESPGGADGARTQVVFSRPTVFEGGRARFPVQLEPHTSWELRVDVVHALDGEESEPRLVASRFGSERARIREALDAWNLRVPQVQASWRPLDRAFEQSVADVASLRIRDAYGGGSVPAAGMPWFMTIFGRDAVITSLQTLLFGPELGINTLDALGDLQATVDDPEIDAEPGKILHELRRGRAASSWFSLYYGSLDATPLYLVLLSEVWRWTDDAELAMRLRGPALAALDWIDRYGDRDGDGFVEYERRTPRGLENQSWKDSGDSQRFHDGRLAPTPIAPVEVQGYVFDAKLRIAEIARVVWRDRPLAERLEAEAVALQQRFDSAFWLPDERGGGYYALALDRDKRPVDSLSSNIGHLLWSGIVPAERVPAVVDSLMSDDLWTGWGFRTMSARDAAYNPLSYHNGTVWPHDTSLAAWGLARLGYRGELHRIVRSLFDAAARFDWSLPEVFAGYDRGETPFPIDYPTAARPQAWAAGTPVLLLRLLLGIEPDRERARFVSTAPPSLPRWAEGLVLAGFRGFGRAWSASVRDGAVVVEESAG